MSVPKKRKSHSRTRMRRNHKHYDPISMGTCPRCGTSRMPHTICGHCGTYAVRGKMRTAVDVEAAETTE